jgi:dUTP pyrophosphatase
MEIPKGYMLMLAPRSSMSKTPLVIPNSFGVIDADYRGEIKGIFKNISDDAYLIQKGDRLLQGILVPVGALKLLEVDELTETVRGTGGIGSTGK